MADLPKGLKSCNYVMLPYRILDELVTEAYGTTYDTLSSTYELHNDTYKTYDDYDYQECLSDINAGGYVEEFATWLKSEEGKLSDETAEFVRLRDTVDFLSWSVMLTYLIMDGKLPRKNYLLEISW